MKAYVFGILAVGVLLFASCGNSDKEEVYTITLNKTSHELKVGEDFMLTASGVPGVEWHAEHPFVASVYGGDITGEHVGKTRIVATYKNATAYCDVTVNTTLPGVLPDVTWAFYDSPEAVAKTEPGTFSSRYEGGAFIEDTYMRNQNRKIDYNFKNQRLYMVWYRSGYGDLLEAMREHCERVTTDDEGLIFYQPVDNYYVRYFFDSETHLYYAPDHATAETLSPQF